MLLLLHLWCALLALATNALAAPLLWLRPQWPLARTVMLAARLALAAQIALGLSLVAQGYVGDNSHYAAAFGAALALWLSSQNARRTKKPARVLAYGHTCAAFATFAAYLLAQR